MSPCSADFRDAQFQEDIQKNSGMPHPGKDNPTMNSITSSMIEVRPLPAYSIGNTNNNIRIEVDDFEEPSSGEIEINQLSDIHCL